ncbi:MAG: glycine--tRNA ligase subunit beta, partial [Pyrinomonadaceae bacterium]
MPRLTSVGFHKPIGSQLSRTLRIQKLAGHIARRLNTNADLAERAAYLCKADLLTAMVGEFAELQGIMGQYYALHDGDSDVVARAIKFHYHPRFAGDSLPPDHVSVSVALADKLDSLVGFFIVGLTPSRDKDPFGLRRHALGIVRILSENSLTLELDELISQSLATHLDAELKEKEGATREWRPGEIGWTYGIHNVDPSITTHVYNFLLERLRSYLRDSGYSANEVESVLSLSPTRLDLVLKQLAAVRAFADLPEAKSLAAANKRVVNILKQAETRKETYNSAQVAMLKEPAERALFDALKKTSKQAASLFERGDFTGYLKSFAVLKSPVDAFFDSV